MGGIGGLSDCGGGDDGELFVVVGPVLGDVKGRCTVFEFTAEVVVS